MKNTIIIGPSKVGKTALVATLKHAASIVSFRDEDVDIRVNPKNDRTRELFTKALDVLRHGDMPFAGTALTVRYDFVISMTYRSKGFWGWLNSLFSRQKSSARFQFMDAPGGAIFSDEVQRTGKRDPNFAKLVDQMCNAQGLIICVDATDALITESKKRADIKAFYKKSMEYLLAHGFSHQLPFENICFVLTKADLYAKKQGEEENAEEFLLTCKPSELVMDIIGKSTLEVLKTYLSEEAKLCFSMTSVFGCSAAKDDSNLGKKRKEEVRLNLEDWVPYNVIESFAFLLSGEAHHPIQEILTYQQIQELFNPPA